MGPASFPHIRYTDQAKVAFVTRDFHLALKLCTKAIACGSSSRTCFVNRAAIYMILRRFELALHDCLMALTLQDDGSDSSPAELFGRISRCHLALGNEHGALIYAKKACESAPHDANALELCKILSVNLPAFKKSRKSSAKNDWKYLRESLNSCFEDAGLGYHEIPPHWWAWKIEIEFSANNLTAIDNIFYNMEGIGLESRRSPNILVPKGLWALLDTRISEAHLVRLWKCLLENIDKAKIREHINLCMVTKRSMDVAHKQARLGNYEESQKLFGICLLDIERMKEIYPLCADRLHDEVLLHRTTALLNCSTINCQSIIDNLESYIMKHPMSLEASVKHAIAHLHMQEYDLAFEEFEELDLPLSYPVDSEWMRKAESEMAKGFYDQAVTFMTYGDGGNQTDIRYGGSLSDVLDSISAKLKRQPQTDAIWIWRFRITALSLAVGDIEDARGNNWDFASDALDRILRVISQASWGIPSEVKVWKAERMLAFGLWTFVDNDAHAIITEVLSVQPDSMVARELEGKLQNIKEYATDFENEMKDKNLKCVELHLRKLAQAFNNEGWKLPEQWFLWAIDLELCQGNKSRAHDLATKRLKCFPKSADACFTSSLTHFLLGNFNESLKNIRLTLQLVHDANLKIAAQGLQKRLQQVDKKNQFEHLDKALSLKYLRQLLASGPSNGE